MNAILLLPLATSKVVEQTDSVFWMMGAITAFFVIGITFLMLLFVFRYSKKRHPKADQIEKNTALEIAWVVIPTLIVLYMFWRGYEGFEAIRTPPPNAMEIDVTGHQWFWTFHYPKADVSTGELWVPVNQAVKLNLHSDDVIHSLYIPGFRRKEDCVPGMETYLWFQPDHEDVYDIFCAEFCGRGHSRMITKLHVVSKEAYRKWLEDQVALRNRPITIEEAMNPDTPALKKIDAATMFHTYCSSCHGDNGQGGLVDGARNFHSMAKWTRSPKLVDIFRTLSEGSPGTQMRPFPGFTRWQKFALAYYVRHFYKGPDQPKSSRDDFEKLFKEYKLDQQAAVHLEFPIDEAIEEMTKKKPQ